MRKLVQCKNVCFLSLFLAASWCFTYRIKILTCKLPISTIIKFKTHCLYTHFCSLRIFTFNKHSGLLLITFLSFFARFFLIPNIFKIYVTITSRYVYILSSSFIILAIIVAFKEVYFMIIVFKGVYLRYIHFAFLFFLHGFH